MSETFETCLEDVLFLKGQLHMSCSCHITSCRREDTMSACERWSNAAYCDSRKFVCVVLDNKPGDVLVVECKRGDTQ